MRANTWENKCMILKKKNDDNNSNRNWRHDFENLFSNRNALPMKEKSPILQMWIHSLDHTNNKYDKI